MQTQFEAFDAEGVFDQPIKPFRIRNRKQQRKKSEQWIKMADGAVLEARTFRVIGPRGFSHRANLPRPNGSAKLIECRSQLKWEGPDKSINRRVKQRRKKSLECCVERRVLADRRSRSQPKKRKDRPRAGWDGLNHNGLTIGPMLESEQKGVKK